jgi:hypothetical protein
MDLTDCTHTNKRYRHLVAAVAALASMLAWAAPPARADGDPASDVLTTQTLYLPLDAGVPAARQAQLGALLRDAARAGYRIRVAVIASSADLGSVTALWRQPQNYARFLGQELPLVYRGPLLVVMPNGYGLYHAAATRLAPLTAGDLGTAAIGAIERLAAASGHAVAPPAAPARSSAGASSAIRWLVFAIGAALIAVAWAASLRARPLATASRGGRGPA